MDDLIYLSAEFKDLPPGTVVIDCDGDAWQNLYEIEGWGPAGYEAGDPLLHTTEFFPVRVVYTPDETEKRVYSIEQLNELSVGAVVLDCGGGAWQKEEYDWSCTGVDLDETGIQELERFLPALVVYEGEKVDN